MQDLTPSPPQSALADRIGIHVSQLRRYEAAKSQPTLDVIRRLATTLAVSADLLIFDDHERDPDNDLKLAFEAAQHLDPDEKAVIKHLIEAVLLKHDAKRWTTAS